MDTSAQNRSAQATGWDRKKSTLFYPIELPFCNCSYFSGFKHRLIVNTMEMFVSLKTRHQSVFMKCVNGLMMKLMSPKERGTLS